MTNISIYPSYSADFMYPVPVVNHGTTFNMNPNVYGTVLQILAQLRTAQSEWNAWKLVCTSLQNSLQRELQLRMKDKLNFHKEEQQLLQQIESLRSELDGNTSLDREREMLQQDLLACKTANLHAQELKNVSNEMSTLKENISNLVSVIQTKDQLLLLKTQEIEKSNEKLQEALQRIRDKDSQVDDLTEERNALKDEIRKLEAEQRENQWKFGTFLEQTMNAMKAELVMQLNAELTLQRQEFQKSLSDLKNNTKEGKLELSEELNRVKEELSRLKSEEAVSFSKIQETLDENLNIMTASLTKQTQLNEELATQKYELKEFLADLKNKSEYEKCEATEELKNFKEEMIKLKAEDQASRSKLQNTLEEKLNVADTLAKQVQLNEELQKQKEELLKLVADLRLQSEELSMKTKVSVLGPCGPAQLQQMKMPAPEGGLYKTALQKHMLPGCVVQVMGSFHSSGDTPSINLDFPHGIALHIVFRFTRGHICRNTYTNGKWGAEETDGGMPVKLGKAFNVTITSTSEYFQICINGAMFATYKHRIDKNLITGIWINGPVELQKVLYFVPNYK